MDITINQLMLGKGTKIKDKEFKHNGKTLRLSNGLKAQAVVFLEERPLYMWMFTPVYKISQSVSGPVNE